MLCDQDSVVYRAYFRTMRRCFLNKQWVLIAYYDVPKLLSIGFDLINLALYNFALPIREYIGFTFSVRMNLLSLRFSKLLTSESNVWMHQESVF